MFTAMKSNGIRYFIKEGFKNVKKNRLMSVASVTTTFATLFILGVFVALTLNVNSWAVQIARDCQIQVFINQDLGAEEYDAIGEKIKELPGVSSIEKYTKEQIFDEMKQKLAAKDGESILAGLEEDNPYRDSFKISLSNLNMTEEVSNKLKEIEGIERVTDFQETAGIIYSISESIKNFSLWIVLILGAISAFIISNAIKVSVFSRRKEIHIMKYIGATNWFVRWPFLVEGVIVGLLGAVIAFAVIWIAYWRLASTINISFISLIPFTELAGVLIICFLIVGILIGFLGSLISIRKHLKV